MRVIELLLAIIRAIGYPMFQVVEDSSCGSYAGSNDFALTVRRSFLTWAFGRVML